jgi:hypothetical protein
MNVLLKGFLKGITFPLVMLGTEGISQTKYVLSPSPSIKVEGGSTLHDWQMETKSAIGEGLFLIEEGQFKGAKSLNLRFQAESLVSGTKGLDKNAYKALNTQKHKEIIFKLNELIGSGTSFTAKGDLTVAGVTNPICFPVILSSTNGKFTFEGKVETKLTTFCITPPTALMGTVKTKDEVRLSFKTTFQPIQ